VYHYSIFLSGRRAVDWYSRRVNYGAYFARIFLRRQGYGATAPPGTASAFARLRRDTRGPVYVSAKRTHRFGGGNVMESLYYQRLMWFAERFCRWVRFGKRTQIEGLNDAVMWVLRQNLDPFATNDSGGLGERAVQRSALPGRRMRAAIFPGRCRDAPLGGKTRFSDLQSCQDVLQYSLRTGISADPALLWGGAAGM